MRLHVCIKMFYAISQRRKRGCTRYNSIDKNFLYEKNAW